MLTPRDQAIINATTTGQPAVILALAFDRRGRIASAVLGRSRGGHPEGELIGFAIDRPTAEAGVHPTGSHELLAALGPLLAAGGPLVVYGLAAVEDELARRLPPEARPHWRSAPRVDLRTASELGMRLGLPIGGIALADLAQDLALPAPGVRDPLAAWWITAGAWDLLLAPGMRPHQERQIVTAPTPREAYRPGDACPLPLLWGERIERDLEALTRRFARIGAPTPSLVHSEPYVAPWPQAGDPLTELSDIAVELDTPLRLGAWSLLGWLSRPDPASSTPSFLPAPGARALVERLPNERRTIDPGRCEHCGTPPGDGRVWLMRSDDQQYLAIAQGCLAPVTGSDPAMLIEQVEAIHHFLPAPGEVPDGWPLPEPLLAVRPTIERAARIVVRDGWHDRDHERSTARAVTAWNRAELEGEQRIRGEFESAYPPTAEADELFAASVRAVEALGDRDPARLSDFERRLLAILRSGFHRPRESGAAAASTLAGLRERERLRLETGSEPPSGAFVGALGERLQGMTVRLIEARQINSDWGPRLRLLARLASGEQVAWWGAPDPLLSPGALLLIDAQVKSHEYDRGDAAPRTELARVEIERIIAPRAE